MCSVCLNDPHPHLVFIGLDRSVLASNSALGMHNRLLDFTREDHREVEDEGCVATPLSRRLICGPFIHIFVHGKFAGWFSLWAHGSACFSLAEIL